MRVLLDANVLVSAFAFGGTCEKVLRLVAARHQLVLGEYVLAETYRILSQKLAHSSAEISRIAERLAEFEIVQLQVRC